MQQGGRHGALRRPLSRRAFLAVLGAGAAAATLGVRSDDAGDWHDPGSWADGRVPRPGDRVVVDRHVRLSRSVRVAGLLVAAGGELALHPDRDVTVTSSASVVVEGRLVARPAGVRHEVVFVDVQESGFRGGHDGTADTDVGLWVQGLGALHLVGGERTAWARLAAPVAPGARELRLDRSPRGWRVGDELVLVPTGGQSAPGAGYDRVRVHAVHGDMVVLDQALTAAHAPVDVPGAGLLGAEVLNLTRDVVVRGGPGARAHVLVQSGGRQVLRHAHLAHLGPSAAVGAEAAAVGGPVPVLGRYGLHLHHCGEAARGVVVEGVVVSDCGNHAFVAHRSPGVTFRDCIAHDTVLSQFWWDAQGVPDGTDDVTYERCVASLARPAPGVAAGVPHLSRRIAGFDLLRGERNRAVDCVAVGSAAGLESAGYVWQEDAEGSWTTAGCSAHDNGEHGSFVWQNTLAPHVVERLASFHNGGYGFVHGAYSNSFRYQQCAAYANGLGAVLRQANPADSGPTQVWRDCVLDAAGRSDHVVMNGPHQFPPSQPVRFEGCTLRGARVSALGHVDADDLRGWTALDLVDCTVDGLDVRVGRTYAASRWRIQRGGRAVELRAVPGAVGPRGSLVERPVPLLAP